MRFPRFQQQTKSPGNKQTTAKRPTISSNTYVCSNGNSSQCKGCYKIEKRRLIKSKSAEIRAISRGLEMFTLLPWWRVFRYSRNVILDGPMESSCKTKTLSPLQKLWTILPFVAQNPSRLKEAERPRPMGQASISQSARKFHLVKRNPPGEKFNFWVFGGELSIPPKNRKLLPHINPVCLQAKQKAIVNMSVQFFEDFFGGGASPSLARCCSLPLRLGAPPLKPLIPGPFSQK